MTRSRRPPPPADAPAAGPDAPPPSSRVLKKYPNRRLYDTVSSSYITLADVKRMVIDRVDFEVRDAKTGEDLTRSILLQIILEEEAGGAPMFSAQSLSQIIRFYGHAMQGVMGTMLEKNLQSFVELQAQLLAGGQGLYDPQQLTPERWTRLLGAQPAALGELMAGYLEQSRAVFEQLQRGVAVFPVVPGRRPPER